MPWPWLLEEWQSQELTPQWLSQSGQQLRPRLGHTCHRSPAPQAAVLAEPSSLATPLRPTTGVEPVVGSEAVPLGQEAWKLTRVSPSCVAAAAVVAAAAAVAVFGCSAFTVATTSPGRL